MNQDEQEKKLIVRKGDRFLLLILTPIVSLWLALICCAIYKQPESSPGWKIAKDLVLDFFITLLIFTWLAQLRSFVNARWLENLLATTWRKIRFFIAIMIIVAAITSWLLFG
jgi:hypothetical protein